MKKIVKALLMLSAAALMASCSCAGSGSSSSTPTQSSQDTSAPASSSVDDGDEDPDGDPDGDAGDEQVGYDYGLKVGEGETAEVKPLSLNTGAGTGKVEYMLTGVQLTAGTKIEIVVGDATSAILPVRGDCPIQLENGAIKETGEYSFYYCESNTANPQEVGLWIEKKLDLEFDTGDNIKAYYLVGTVNNWKNQAHIYAFEKEAEQLNGHDVYRLVATLPANCEFKVRAGNATGDDGYYPAGPTNIKVTEAKEYTIRFVAEGDPSFAHGCIHIVGEAVPDTTTLYLRGTAVGGWDVAASNALGAPEQEGQLGVIKNVALSVGDFKISNSTWAADKTYGYKKGDDVAVIGGAASKFEAAAGEDNNIHCKEAGNYDIYMMANGFISIEVHGGSGPVVSNVTATKNGAAITLTDVKTSKEAESNNAKYQIELSLGDKLAFKDGETDLYFYHWDATEEKDVKDSTEYTAVKAGLHTVYYNKKGELWVTQPADPVGVLTATKNGNPLEITNSKESTDTANKAKVVLELAKGDKIKLFEDAVALHFYAKISEVKTDQGVEYTAGADGEYTFYINKDSEVWTVAPSVTPDPSETVKFTVTVPDAWEAAYAYAWKGDNQNKAWPGVAMTLKSGHTYEVELAKGYEKIIFNNGSGTQTENLDLDYDNPTFDVSTPAASTAHTMALGRNSEWSNVALDVNGETGYKKLQCTLKAGDEFKFKMSENDDDWRGYSQLKLSDYAKAHFEQSAAYVHPGETDPVSDDNIKVKAGEDIIVNIYVGNDVDDFGDYLGKSIWIEAYSSTPTPDPEPAAEYTMTVTLTLTNGAVGDYTALVWDKNRAIDNDWINGKEGLQWTEMTPDGDKKVYTATISGLKEGDVIRYEFANSPSYGENIYMSGSADWKPASVTVGKGNVVISASASGFAADKDHTTVFAIDE